MAICFPSPTMLASGIYRPKFVFPANGLVTLAVSIPSVGVAGKLSNATNSSLRCNAFSVPRTQDGSRNGLTVLHWSEKTSQVLEKDSYAKVLEWSKMKSQIDEIRAILTSMEDGEISISAYDTAWVALIEDVNNGGAPLFPSSLEWIADNQLPDGSWGDPHIYLAHDRIINTLACVIALKTWNVCEEKCEQGMSFLKDNIWKLQDEDEEHMLIGFEIAFPSLLEIARSLKLELPYDSPIFNDIYAKRNLKLKRIPKDVIHKVPTTLLHSLEGTYDLDWQKLVKLQCADGSFLFSPSSTAFAFTQTKDEKCARYLMKMVERFNGGVPNVYPVDMFEHIWAVDRLERLGISRYFRPEIRNCLDYVYRYWTDDGICWARNTSVQDVDDTAMGFRLLRLHGYEVSADVFQNFEKGGEFFCFAGQSNQAVTGIYNLNRASQVMFPGEKILQRAKAFSSKFLRVKQVANELIDKWIITKDLAGEVAYALDFPWLASLPRIETRFYINQYGGEEDVWIGKTLYRMPYVNNSTYLEVAKSDFNHCQSIHQSEWIHMHKWYIESNLGRYGVSEESMLRAYFLAAATAFEPEKALERVAWARSQVLMEAISFYFNNLANTSDKSFVQDFIASWVSKETKKAKGGLSDILVETLNFLSLEAIGAHERNINHRLRCTWETWLSLMCSGRKDDNKHPTMNGELLALTVNLCAGYSLSQELLSDPNYTRLTRLTNDLCHHLGKTQMDEDGANWKASHSIECDLQEFTQCVLQSSNSVAGDIKQTFLNVIKSFYYMAYCPSDTVKLHIAQVLFERVA